MTASVYKPTDRNFLTAFEILYCLNQFLNLNCKQTEHLIRHSLFFRIISSDTEDFSIAKIKHLTKATELYCLPRHGVSPS